MASRAKILKKKSLPSIPMVFVILVAILIIAVGGFMGMKYYNARKKEGFLVDSNYVACNAWDWGGGDIMYENVQHADCPAKCASTIDCQGFILNLEPDSNGLPSKTGCWLKREAAFLSASGPLGGGGHPYREGHINSTFYKNNNLSFSSCGGKIIAPVTEAEAEPTAAVNTTYTFEAKPEPQPTFDNLDYIDL